MNLIKLFFLSCTISLTAHAMQQPEDDLLAAAKTGNLELVQHLIDAGVDVNYQNKDGNTALIETAWNGHSDCLQPLLQAGTKVDLQDNDGFTALIDAATNGHLACLQLLLQAGAKADLQNDYGETALIKAASRGYSDCLQTLLQAGAKVDLKDNNGYTALILAAYNRHQPCYHLLLDRMMQLPSDTQKQKLYTFLWCMKKCEFGRDVRSLFKPFLLAVVQEENYENPEQSFAWQEVQRVDQSEQQPLLDYLKRKLS